MRVTEFALQLSVITDTGAEVQSCRGTGARFARRPLIGFGRTTTPAASEEMYYSVFLSPCFLFLSFPFYNDDGMLYNGKTASMPLPNSLSIDQLRRENAYQAAITRACVTRKYSW